MRFARSMLLCVTSALLGCEGKIVGERAPQPAAPARCEPGVHQVPKLLRVSNFEYQQMVADVIGEPVDSALFSRWTPIAQVYGFDTMSESRLDGRALEEQLATAERLAAQVLATPALTAHCPAPSPLESPACTLKTSYAANFDFADTQGRDCWSYRDSAGAPMAFDNTRSLWRKLPDENALISATSMHPGSTVNAVRRWASPATGRVALSGRFGDADPGGGDGVVVSIVHNGATVWAQTIANGAEATFDLAFTVGRADVVDFIVNRNQNTAYDTTAVTATVAFTPTPRKAAWTWQGCVGPLVTRLASRGFRRPARAEELADYQQLFETTRQGAATAGFAEPVDEALSAVVQAVLLSPNFVFKPELVPGGLDRGEQGFGIASRLALYFRGSVADEPLWSLASTGALQDPAVVEAQARRLLDDNLPRFARHFGGQWLDYRESVDLGPLTQSMQHESASVFEAVVSKGLAAERLISPGFTVVDEPLAKHYGLPFTGDAQARHTVSTSQRGGLLSQAGFLTRTATGSEFRRPIHRGLWVLTRLMCRTLPRLDAATLEEISRSVGSIDRSLPLSEQMKLHRDSTLRCNGCHGLMDPVGLALENYDRVGAWRETYDNGAPITNDLEFEGVVVRDPAALATAIEGSPDFRACVATKLLTFGLNRGPLDEEQCVAQTLASPADGSTPSLKDLTVRSVLSALRLTEVQP